MKRFLRLLMPTSWRDVLIHLVVIAALSVSIVLYIFNVYLPATTRHGQSITVPNLKGMKVEKVQSFLEKKNLDYFISDSTFKLKAEPNTVFSQFPKPGRKVKKGREIQISVYAKTPPVVELPKVHGRQAPNAEDLLESFGLVPEIVEYRPDLQEGAVLEVRIDGEKVKPGTKIPKGTKVEMVVGDGLSNEEVEVPDLTGDPPTVASLRLEDAGLQMYKTYNPEPEADSLVPGAIYKQKPKPGTVRRRGDVVDVWIAGPPPPEEEDILEDPADSLGLNAGSPGQKP